MASIDVVEIPREGLDALLESAESHFLDFKAKEVSPGKLTRSLSAFANASGGDLYIGIDEGWEAGATRSWRGFTDPEEANGHIQAFEELFPLGGSGYYEFVRCPGESGLVLHVTVLKSRRIATATDGTAYIRRGAQNLPVKTAEAMRRLELDKGLVTFEEETVNADLETVTTSAVARGFMEALPVSQPVSAEGWMRKQQLVRADRPTVAGVMLFSDVPQAVLPKRSAIKLYRFRTSDAAGTRELMAEDPITIEGCAYEQIYEAVELTVALVEEIPRLGKEGLEEVRYPHETIHEIITNAVLHRDYSFPQDIHIRVFDNRVEIESPGTLP